MATTSTPEENDPEADNRAEYTPPPCVLDAPEYPADEDGYLADEEVYEEAAYVDPVASE